MSFKDETHPFHSPMPTSGRAIVDALFAMPLIKASATIFGHVPVYPSYDTAECSPIDERFDICKPVTETFDLCILFVQ